MGGAIVADMMERNTADRAAQLAVVEVAGVTERGR